MYQREFPKCIQAFFIHFFENNFKRSILPQLKKWYNSDGCHNISNMISYIMIIYIYIYIYMTLNQHYNNPMTTIMNGQIEDINFIPLVLRLNENLVTRTTSPHFGKTSLLKTHFIKPQLRLNGKKGVLVSFMNVLMLYLYNFFETLQYWSMAVRTMMR